MRTGWHLLDTRTSGLTFLADPEADRPACRFNDGSVDPAGRFWTGSLEDSEAFPLGRLYRLDGDGTCTAVDEGFYCSNGMDWLAEWPLSGSVLRRAADTPGRPPSHFRLGQGVTP
jgi:sugar lactone lactonase YvrE